MDSGGFYVNRIYNQTPHINKTSHIARCLFCIHLYHLGNLKYEDFPVRPGVDTVQGV